MIDDWNPHDVGSFMAREEGSDKLEEVVAVADYNRLLEFLNSPETEEFDKGVPLEAGHQIQRWGTKHDAGKTPADWFWLVGYLAGKCLSSHIAGNKEKALHHTISTAAALRNWHSAISKGESFMRPGIAEDER